MSETRTLSISKARRILGKRADSLSDDQIRELLTTLHLLARQHLGYNGSKKAHTHDPQ